MTILLFKWYFYHSFLQLYYIQLPSITLCYIQLSCVTYIYSQLLAIQMHAWELQKNPQKVHVWKSLLPTVTLCYLLLYVTYRHPLLPTSSITHSYMPNHTCCIISMQLHSCLVTIVTIYNKHNFHIVAISHFKPHMFINLSEKAVISGNCFTST